MTQRLIWDRGLLERIPRFVRDDFYSAVRQLYLFSQDSSRSVVSVVLFLARFYAWDSQEAIFECKFRLCGPDNTFLKLLRL